MVRYMLVFTINPFSFSAILLGQARKLPPLMVYNFPGSFRHLNKESSVPFLNNSGCVK